MRRALSPTSSSGVEPDANRAVRDLRMADEIVVAAMISATPAFVVGAQESGAAARHQVVADVVLEVRDCRGRAPRCSVSRRAARRASW